MVTISSCCAPVLLQEPGLFCSGLSQVALFHLIKHISAAEYFVLKGKVEVRGGKENGGVTSVAGDYGYEPNGVIHEKTYFPEPTEYLFISHGPIQYLNDDGNTSGIIDWLTMQEKWDSAEIVT